MSTNRGVPQTVTFDVEGFIAATKKQKMTRKIKLNLFLATKKKATFSDTQAGKYQCFPIWKVTKKQNNPEMSVKVFNERLAASGLGDVNLPAQTKGIMFTKHPDTNTLTMVPFNADTRAPEAPTASEIVMVLTPMCRIVKAYGFNAGRGWTSDMPKPNQCIYFGPPNPDDRAEWDRMCNPISHGLIDELCKALKKHGTCIKSDPVDKAMKAEAKKGTDAVFATWVKQQLALPGSPHMSTVKKLIDDPNESIVATKAYVGTGDGSRSDMDDLVDADTAAAFEAEYGPKWKTRPTPLFYKGKQVAAKDYLQTAARLQGALAYIELGYKAYTNATNKVLSIKPFLAKIVISELGPETGGGSAIVDVVGMTEDGVLDVSADNDDLDVIAAAEAEERPAKRSKTN